MNFCPNCGKQLAEDTRFCPSCGKAITETQEQQGATSTPPPVEAPQDAAPVIIPAATFQKSKKKLLWLLLIPALLLVALIITRLPGYDTGKAAGKAIVLTGKQVYETYRFRTEINPADTQRFQDIQRKLLQPALSEDTITYRLIAADGTVALEVPLACDTDGIQNAEEFSAAQKAAITE